MDSKDNGCCPVCAGKGVVVGVVDDVDFDFVCLCMGGSEVAVRWLLGNDDLSVESPAPDWTIQGMD